jgi:hypothetical protein
LVLEVPDVADITVVAKVWEDMGYGDTTRHVTHGA